MVTYMKSIISYPSSSHKELVEVLYSKPFKEELRGKLVFCQYQIIDIGKQMYQFLYVWKSDSWKPVKWFNEDGGTIIKNKDLMTEIRNTYSLFNYEFLPEPAKKGLIH